MRSDAPAQARLPNDQKQREWQKEVRCPGIFGYLKDFRGDCHRLTHYAEQDQPGKRRETRAEVPVHKGRKAPQYGQGEGDQDDVLSFHWQVSR